MTTTTQQPLVKPASNESTAKSKDPLERLRTLKAMYGPIQVFPRELDHAAKLFAERFELEQNDYKNPFHEYSAHTDLVRNIRNKLINFAVDELMTEYPNVTVDREKLIKHMDDKEGELGFNVHTIYEHIKTNYLDNVTALSLQEIKEKAKELVPYHIYTGNGYETRPATVDDIVKGKKLVLRCHFSLSYDGRAWLYQRAENIRALERLIHIITQGATPDRVEGDAITTLYNTLEQDRDQPVSDCYKKHEVNQVIKSVRLYKNHRLDVELASHEDALKVAKVLIGE